MKLTDSGSGDFIQAPVGNHPARCIKLIDIGTQEGEWQGKARFRRQIVVMWELPTEPLPMGDSDWQRFCHEATEEIMQDIDAAIMRTAANSSLADAIMLAGYLKRGHLFDKHTERCPSHIDNEEME